MPNTSICIGASLWNTAVIFVSHNTFLILLNRDSVRIVLQLAKKWTETCVSLILMSKPPNRAALCNSDRIFQGKIILHKKGVNELLVTDRCGHKLKVSKLTLFECCQRSVVWFKAAGTTKVQIYIALLKNIDSHFCYWIKFWKKQCLH